MLKVKTDKGNFDIVLNEENFFDARGTDRALKGRTKGLHSKPPQARVSHPTAFKSQVTNVNQGKTNEKVNSRTKSNQREKVTKKKTASATKTVASKDASYLTKDQLSKILSSLNGENRSSSTTAEGIAKSEGRKTSVDFQFSTADNEKRDLVASAHYVKTSGGDTAKPQQTSLSQKNLLWKMELDTQVALKQKLQKQKNSKESEFQDYNPWGRPGGGAPIRTQSGNVVADYKKMGLNEAVGPAVETAKVRPSIMTTGEDTSTHNVNPEIPVAMRSSFAVGAPGIVQYKTDQYKTEEKKKWLQDLEQQIKEKKDKDAQEKLHHSLMDASGDSWHQNESIASVIVASNNVRGSPMTVETSSSSTIVGSGSVNIHARGHGLQSLALVNRDELEKKRLKTLEHQLAIKEQVEEKRRLKQEEKERAMREEAEKERALAQERQRLEIQYEEELKQQQQKEEEARRRTEALQKSVLQAYESAQQQRAAKRIKDLESAGHDVSGLKSGLEKVAPRTNQDTHGSMLKQSTEIPEANLLHTAAHSGRETATLSSPRIPRRSLELPKESDQTGSTLLSGHKEPFEQELNEINLSESLESRWTPSSPVSIQNTYSQEKMVSPSSCRDGVQRIKKVRSQSEKGQRKKQPSNQKNNKRSFTKQDTHEVDVNPPAPLEDAFMLPYRRTSSATFPVQLDTPLVGQNTRVDVSKSPRKSKSLQTAGNYKQVKESNRKATNMKNDNMRIKLSEMAKSSPKPSSKRTNMSKMSDEKCKVSQQSSQLDDRKSPLLTEKISPEPLATARQEMILKQLAALRQGLMMKERELQFGALS